jgi:4'-phosphopantetheinyl transferase
MITVWWVDLDDARALEGDGIRTLSTRERQRGERFRFEKHRARWLAGRIALRRILADELGVAPGEIEYETGVHGKPSLAGKHAGALEFNLSHSGGRALVAIARGMELGVDVEEIHAMEDIHAVAERHFAAEEREHLFSLPAGEQVPGFYRLWTRKEAYIKAIGTGLGHPLDQFAVTEEAGRCHFVHLDGDREAAREWSLVHIDPPHRAAHGGDGFVGAMAIARPEETVELRQFEWTD